MLMVNPPLSVGLVQIYLLLRSKRPIHVQREGLDMPRPAVQFEVFTRLASRSAAFLFAKRISFPVGRHRSETGRYFALAGASHSSRTA